MIKKIIRQILDSAGYRISSTKYLLKQFEYPQNTLELDFDHVMSNYLLNVKQAGISFKFIQIGAFDGVECDPLWKYLQRYDWKGVMLEPQPVPFSKLKELYNQRSNVSVRNFAIGAENGTAELYILEGNDLPEWSKGMASFNKENILKHNYLIPGIENYIKAIDVRTVTFEKLFQEESLDMIDLLQVDTEGFDAQILKMFPFSSLKPKLIHFESKHIPKKELESLLDYLLSLGYKVARDRGEDMIAVLEENTNI